MGKAYKILIVDDEEDIIEFIQYNLSKEGYKVKHALNGKQAIEIAREYNPDLILLDVMMPVMDGIQTCKILRADDKFKSTFIVFLTARAEEYSEIAGLEAGADDYIAKPIKPAILVSRLNAILRRKEKLKIEGKLDLGNIIIDRESFLVYLAGEKLHLARKEFELLHMMASNPGRVFSRDELLENIWGDDVFVGDRTVDVHIRKIREKIGDKHIGTVKGVGYKFEL